jgi:hypothetical protein
LDTTQISDNDFHKSGNACVQLGHAKNRQKKPKQSLNFQPVIIFSPSKLYIELTTDILPRAPWNSCEEIFRIKNTRFNLLKTLKFSYGLCHKNGKQLQNACVARF